MWAIAEKKRIIALVEEDTCFAAFDCAAFAKAAKDAQEYAAAEACTPGSGAFLEDPFFPVESRKKYVKIVLELAE